MGKPIDPEKLRDMMRSILPSRARKSAREWKAIENRKVRRGVRSDLRCRDAEADLERDADHRRTIDRRRGADKLNHFLRWCRALTYGMPTPRALNFVRALLPRTVIGDHAYGHWYWPRLYGWKSPYPRDYMARQAQAEYDRTRSALARILREDPCVLGELNALVRSRRKVEGQPLRMLFGAHDVDDYVRDALKLRIEKECLLEIIEKFKKGGRKGRPSFSWLRPKRPPFSVYPRRIAAAAPSPPSRRAA